MSYLRIAKAAAIHALGLKAAEEHLQRVHEGWVAPYRAAAMPSEWSEYSVPGDLPDVRPLWTCERCGLLTSAGYAQGELQVVRDPKTKAARLKPMHNSFRLVCFGCAYDMKEPITQHETIDARSRRKSA